MIIVSNIINKYYAAKLRNKSYRKKIFHSALKHELRNSKIGKVILRNLNDLMSENIEIHKEFTDIVGEENFQNKFWESDLGYLWFEGNSNVSKPYFNDTIELIKKSGSKNLLDVGCGWGIFCNKCLKETNLSNIKGIDISIGVIENASNKFKSHKLVFTVQDLFEADEKFDFVTIFGSIDYVKPEQIEKFILKMINIADKHIVIVNSLRKISLDDSMNLTSSREIQRYDIGYVHPLNHILTKHKQELNYNFTITKSGIDSAFIVVTK